MQQIPVRTSSTSSIKQCPWHSKPVNWKIVAIVNQEKNKMDYQLQVYNNGNIAFGGKWIT